MQGALHPLATGCHECFEPRFALLVAGCFVWCVVAAKAEDFLVHNEVNVLGEAIDELPRFGKRSATFESEVFADAGEGEKFAERPANPEVFLDALGMEMHRILEFEAGFFLVLRGAVEKCVHLWGFGVTDDLAKNIRDPCGGTR